MSYTGAAGVDGESGRDPLVYSVFDYHTNLFTYYAPAVGAAPVLPPSGQMRSPRGVTPESAAVRVPAGAKVVGTGKAARGLIATTSEGVGSVGEADSMFSPGGWFVLGLAAHVGMLFWWRAYNRKRKPR